MILWSPEAGDHEWPWDRTPGPKVTAAAVGLSRGQDESVPPFATQLQAFGLFDNGLKVGDIDLSCCAWFRNRLWSTQDEDAIHAGEECGGQIRMAYACHQSLGFNVLVSCFFAWIVKYSVFHLILSSVGFQLMILWLTFVLSFNISFVNVTLKTKNEAMSIFQGSPKLFWYLDSHLPLSGEDRVHLNRRWCWWSKKFWLRCQ